MAKQRSTDSETFRAAVRDVTPLAQTPLAAGLAKPKPRARLRNTAASATENLDETMPLVSGLPADDAASTADVVTGDGALSFQRAGVRIQVIRRLRRGFFPIDQELD